MARIYLLQQAGNQAVEPLNAPCLKSTPPVSSDQHGCCCWWWGLINMHSINYPSAVLVIRYVQVNRLEGDRSLGSHHQS